MKRLPAIDFLRGVAVILVLFRHHPFLTPLYNAGWIGVDLFFVLSGYLVSSLLFKEQEFHKKISPMRFLVRRGFKIYPLFYTMIATTLGIAVLLNINLGIYNVVSEIVFFQNYFGRIWNHTWSLAVEEHFYFGLTLFVYILIVTKLIDCPRFMVVICISIFLVCLGLRLCNNILFDYSHKTHLYPTHLRIDSLLFGVLLSYLHCFMRHQFENFFIRNRMMLYITFITLVSPAFIFPVESFFINTIGLTLLYVGFGIILCIFITDQNILVKLNRLLGKKLVNAIVLTGFYSYGIYLFHMLVKVCILGVMHKAGFVFNYRIDFFIYFVTSIFIGIIMSRMIEQPFLKIREKVIPKFRPNTDIEQVNSEKIVVERLARS